MDDGRDVMVNLHKTQIDWFTHQSLMELSKVISVRVGWEICKIVQTLF